jgi:nicotinic acid mononucleotide adenylyltransferase
MDPEERERLHGIVQRLSEKTERGEPAIELVYEARERRVPTGTGTRFLVCPGNFYPPHIGHEEMFRHGLELLDGVAAIATLTLSSCTGKSFDPERTVQSLYMLGEERKHFPFLGVAVASTGYLKEIASALPCLPLANATYAFGFGADIFQRMFGTGRAAAYEMLGDVPWVVADRNGDTCESIDLGDQAVHYDRANIHRLELPQDVRQISSTMVRDLLSKGNWEEADAYVHQDHLLFIKEHGLRDSLE